MKTTRANPHVILHFAALALLCLPGITLGSEQREKAVDLMPLIHPNTDAVKGKWNKQGKDLISDNASPATLEIPYIPPEEYDFRISFTRRSGNEGVHQILYKSGHTFQWTVGARSSSKMCFMLINRQSFDNASAVSKPQCIVNNRRYVSIVSVRNGSVTATLNGIQIVNWKTDYHEMDGLFGGFQLRNPNRLGIASWASPTVFHSIEILEVTGKGTVAKDGPEQSAASASSPTPKPTPPAPTPETQATPTPGDRIKQIKQLLDQGLINKEEYDRRVKVILDAI